MKISRIVVIIFLLLFHILNAFSQNTVLFSASDSNILYTGRVDVSVAENVVFAYPGVCIHAKFEGTSVIALLSDLGSGSETTTNYFNVIIDGQEPVVLELDRNKPEYVLASGLSDEEHTLILFKRTESNVGSVVFGGLKLEEGRELLAPDALPERKIEFIGNSITCGYGNDISVSDPGNYHFTSKNENNYKAWGAVTARNFNAQYSCVAYSGKGLIQNVDGSKNETMTILYDRIVADDANSVWDHSKYIPDVLVVNLGTNDFSAEINNADNTVVDTVFTSAYVAFIEKLRGHYPDASIICTVGTMMSDGYPSGLKHWSRIQEYVTAAVTNMNNSGDANVYYLKLNPQTSPYGEDWHPTAATAEKMAKKLTDFIVSNLNWELPTSAKNKIEVDKQLFLYPNPCFDKAYIKGKNIGRLSIHNMSGKLVYKYIISDQNKLVDLSEVPSGLYLVSLANNDKLIQQKIMKR